MFVRILLAVCSVIVVLVAGAKLEQRKMKLSQLELMYEGSENDLLVVCDELVKRHERESGRRITEEEFDDALVVQLRKMMQESELQSQMKKTESLGPGRTP